MTADVSTYDLKGVSFMELLTADWVVDHLDHFPISSVDPDVEPPELLPLPMLETNDDNEDQDWEVDDV